MLNFPIYAGLSEEELKYVVKGIYEIPE